MTNNTRSNNSPDTDQGTSQPNGLWNRQFETRFDFPVTDLVRRFALCTTPRCGSHYFGHLLHGLGGFGYPLEYFNDKNWAAWKGRAMAGGDCSTLDYIKSVRTGPGGVFATKLHQEHLEFFLTKEADPLSYRYVHLQRRDLLKQAISFAKAQQTNAWISDMPQTASASYDWDLIAQKMNSISLGNANWESFLTATGCRFLKLYYEDIAADSSAAVSELSEFLEVEVPASTDQKISFKPKRQKTANDETADWAERFVRDSRTRLAEHRVIPGVLGPANEFTPAKSVTQAARSFARKLRPARK